MKQGSNKNNLISSFVAWWTALHPTERPMPGADIATQNYKTFIDDLVLHWKAASADIEKALTKQKNGYHKQFIDLAKKVRRWHSEARKELIDLTLAKLKGDAERAAKATDSHWLRKDEKELLSSFTCLDGGGLFADGQPVRAALDAALRQWDEALDQCVSFSLRLPILCIKSCPICPTFTYNGTEQPLWHDILWDKLLSHSVPIMSHEGWKSSQDLHREALEGAKLHLLGELREQVRDHPFYAVECRSAWAKSSVLAWLLKQADNTPDAITSAAMASHLWSEYESWLKRVTLDTNMPNRDKWLAQHNETEFTSMLGARAQFGGNLHVNESALMFAQFLIEETLNAVDVSIHTGKQDQDAEVRHGGKPSPSGAHHVSLVEEVKNHWRFYVDGEYQNVRKSWDIENKKCRAIMNIIKARGEPVADDKLLCHPEIATHSEQMTNPDKIAIDLTKADRKGWSHIFVRGDAHTSLCEGVTCEYVDYAEFLRRKTATATKRKVSLAPRR